MAIRWTIDTEQGFFREEWEGPVSAEDACAAIDEATRDPRYGPGMRGLLDMRRAEMELSDDAIDSIFHKKREFGALHAGWRWALLGRTSEQLAACAEYASRTALTPVEVSTFESEAEALEWLGVHIAAVDA